MATILTLGEIFENLWYDLIFDDGSIRHGKIDYVTSHLNDGGRSEMRISDSQPSVIQDFVNEYKANCNGRSIEQYYHDVYANA